MRWPTMCYVFTTPAALSVKSNRDLVSYELCLWLIHFSWKIEKPPDYPKNDASQALTCQVCPSRVGVIFLWVPWQGLTRAPAWRTASALKLTWKGSLYWNHRAPFCTRLCIPIKDAGLGAISSQSWPCIPYSDDAANEGTREMHENSRVYAIVRTSHEPHVSVFHSCAFCFNTSISVDLVLVVLYLYYVWQKLGEKNIYRKSYLTWNRKQR